MISQAAQTAFASRLSTVAIPVRDLLRATAHRTAGGRLRGGIFNVLPNRDDVPTEGVPLVADSANFTRRWTPRSRIWTVANAVEGEPAVVATGLSWKDIYDASDATVRVALRWLDRNTQTWITAVDSRLEDLEDISKIGAVWYFRAKDLAGVICERAVGSGYTNGLVHPWAEVTP